MNSKNIVLTIIFIFLLLSGFFVFNTWLRNELCRAAGHSDALAKEMDAYTLGSLQDNAYIGREELSTLQH